MLPHRFTINFKMNYKTHAVLKELSEIEDQPISVILRRLIMEEAERKTMKPIVSISSIDQTSQVSTIDDPGFTN